VLARLGMAGATRHQTGDDEFRLLFPAASLGVIAKLVNASRRRVGGKGMSPEHMRRVTAARMARRALSATA